MKKIISLLASVAMLASMVTSVSAASIATNSPVASTVIEEIDASYFEEYTYETLEEGQKAFLVTVAFTGLDLSNVRGGSATTDEKKTRTGTVFSAGQYEIIWDSEDHIVGIFDEDREEPIMDPLGVFTQTGTSLCIFNANGIADMLPKASNNNDKVVTAEEIVANSFVVLTDGKPVTGTVKAECVIRQKEMSVRVGILNCGPEQIGYSVNGEDTNKVTLPGAATPDPDPEPVENIVWTDRMDLTAGELKGAAWDVTIKKFDAAKTYVATFTNTADSTDIKTRDMDLSYFAETTGEVNFVALLKLNKDRVVDLKVEEKE